MQQYELVGNHGTVNRYINSKIKPFVVCLDSSVELFCKIKFWNPVVQSSICMLLECSDFSIFVWGLYNWKMILILLVLFILYVLRLVKILMQEFVLCPVVFSKSIMYRIVFLVSRNLIVLILLILLLDF